jgi:D-alanyl-D-alanine carboxypeptidase
MDAKVIAWTVGLLLAVGLGAGARLATGAPNPQEVLQRDVDAIGATGVTGVQARLTEPTGEALVATSGVADRETGRPVPVNGRYRIASTTKAFVATAILQLVGEGRLSLDDSVERHLPGVVSGQGYEPDRITIRDLLQHTSGVYDYNHDETWDPFSNGETFAERRFDRYELGDLVAVAVAHPPRFEPGTEHLYSNTNYILAGMVLEAVTGNPWAEEVRARIIDPLGLEHTTVPDGAAMPTPHASGYTQFEPGGPLVDTTELDPSAGGSGGAIISTPADVTTFFAALLGGELLEPPLLAAMKDTVPALGGRYGLGLAWSPLSCGGGYWRHGGAVPGYLSYEGFSEDGRRGVVVSVSSMQVDEAVDLGQQRAADALIDRAFCGD